MEYSAVSQPPVTLCSFIQRGTASSIITPQITRVLPIETSTEPLACGAMPKSNATGRSRSLPRPSIRSMTAKVDRAQQLVIEEFFVSGTEIRSSLVSPVAGDRIIPRLALVFADGQLGGEIRANANDWTKSQNG